MVAMGQMNATCRAPPHVSPAPPQRAKPRDVSQFDDPTHASQFSLRSSRDAFSLASRDGILQGWFGGKKTREGRGLCPARFRGKDYWLLQAGYSEGETTEEEETEGEKEREKKRRVVPVAPQQNENCHETLQAEVAQRRSPRGGPTRGHRSSRVRLSLRWVGLAALPGVRFGYMAWTHTSTGCQQLLFLLRLQNNV
jgi:hypothetical protein